MDIFWFDCLNFNDFHVGNLAIMKFYLFAVLLFSQVSFASGYTKFERKTIDTAFTALEKLQLLHIVSKLCDNYEYSDLAPREEFDSLVNKKLKLNLEKFELMAEEKEFYVASMRYHLEGFSCDKIDVEEYLSDLYDDYDIEKFNLELFDPITIPLVTKREAAHQSKLALNKYIETHAKEAESIAIAYLIPIEQASPKYVQNARTSSIKSEYIYEISKGWKKPLINQYFTPPFSTSMSLKAGSYGEQMATRKKVKELFFIKQDKKNAFVNIIIGSINLDLYSADLSFLSEPDWEWVNYKLIK